MNNGKQFYQKLTVAKVSGVEHKVPPGNESGTGIFCWWQSSAFDFIKSCF